MMHTLRSRALDIGTSRGREVTLRIGAELRLARTTAGLTQQAVARLAGTSQSIVSRIERGAVLADLLLLSRVAAAVGHQVSIRLFPTRGVSVRDSGQLELIQAILVAAHAGWQRAIEVRVSADVRDLRSADALLTSANEVMHIEVERTLIDLQAQLRAGLRKREAISQRLGRPVRFVLALVDGRRARDLVTAHSDVVSVALPATSSEVWRSIRTQNPLGRDGLLFVRPQPRSGRARKARGRPGP